MDKNQLKEAARRTLVHLASGDADPLDGPTLRRATLISVEDARITIDRAGSPMRQYPTHRITRASRDRLIRQIDKTWSSATCQMGPDESWTIFLASASTAWMIKNGR